MWRSVRRRRRISSVKRAHVALCRVTVSVRLYCTTLQRSLSVFPYFSSRARMCCNSQCTPHKLKEGARAPFTLCTPSF